MHCIKDFIESPEEPFGIDLLEEHVKQIMIIANKLRDSLISSTLCLKAIIFCTVFPVSKWFCVVCYGSAVSIDSVLVSYNICLIFPEPLSVR